MKQYYALIAIAIIILNGCSGDSNQKIMESQLTPIENQTATGIASPDKNNDEQNVPVEDTVAAPAPPEPATGKKIPGKNEYIDWDKKIIKTADLSFELKDYKAFNTTVHNGLKAYGAYIAQEHQSQSDYKKENGVVIKVPVEQFDNLLNSIQGDGIKIIEKNISSEDVTGEVVDTKSRLEAKKQVREKYLELLKQAKNMDEILQVQNEINAIQEQIESANGRINYLQHSSAYSTVNLKYFQYLTANGQQEDHPDFFSRMSEAFKNGASIVLNLFLLLITVWPILIAGFITVLIIKKYRVKKV